MAPEPTQRFRAAGPPGRLAPGRRRLRRLGARRAGGAHGRRDVAQGAVYVTLVRLEKKGLLRSRLSDPTPVRGGKAKRLFRITAGGRRGRAGAAPPHGPPLGRPPRRRPRTPGASRDAAMTDRPPAHRAAPSAPSAPGAPAPAPGSSRRRCATPSRATWRSASGRDAARDSPRRRRRYWKDVLSPSLLRLRREVRGMPLPPGAPHRATGPGDGRMTPCSPT